jgi:hypothetical protein
MDETVFKVLHETIEPYLVNQVCLLRLSGKIN